jgi:AAA+ ATPase superfamily predicted ATPase
MALFDLGPKDAPSSLFGRKAELDRLTELVNARRWTALLGPRMVGKTSLLKATNKLVKRPGIYVNLWGARGTSGLVNAFAHGLNSSQGLWEHLRNRLRNIEGLSIGPGGVSVTAPARPLRTLWDMLDVLGSRRGGCIVELDEVQELATVSGPLSKLLANVFNSHPNIVFVFTGSYIGLVRTLLDPSTSSPLFGRPPARIDLRAFDTATAVDFLKKGLAEYRMTVPVERLRKVVEESLGGTPGWLSLYGNALAVQHLDPDPALELTVTEASKVVREELKHFLEGRDRATYMTALKAAALGTTWGGIRSALSAARPSPVNDKTVQSVLQRLRGAGFLFERDGSYRVEDPVLRRVVLAARA